MSHAARCMCVLILIIASSSTLCHAASSFALAGQASMATGFWRSSSSSSYSDNKSSLRIFAHSVAGYVSYYLPSNSALMQPTQGRALSYECLGPNAYRAIFQEIYFPVQGQPGIARTFCTVRAFDQTGSTMYYVDGESDGKCPEAELVLSQRHRKLLGGGNEGQRNSGILIRVPSSAITPPPPRVPRPLPTHLRGPPISQSCPTLHTTTYL